MCLFSLRKSSDWQAMVAAGTIIKASGHYFNRPLSLEASDECLGVPLVVNGLPADVATTTSRMAVNKTDNVDVTDTKHFTPYNLALYFKGHTIKSANSYKRMNVAQLRQSLTDYNVPYTNAGTYISLFV
jgi:hypothetical protein